MIEKIIGKYLAGKGAEQCTREITRYHLNNAKVSIKDHQYANLLSELRDTSKKYAGADQLRSRLGGVLSRYLERSDELI